MMKEIFLFDKRHLPFYPLTIWHHNNDVANRKPLSCWCSWCCCFGCIDVFVLIQSHCVTQLPTDIKHMVSTLEGEQGAFAEFRCFLLTAITQASFYETKELELLMKIRAPRILEN